MSEPIADLIWPYTTPLTREWLCRQTEKQLKSSRHKRSIPRSHKHVGINKIRRLRLRLQLPSCSINTKAATMYDDTTDNEYPGGTASTSLQAGFTSVFVQKEQWTQTVGCRNKDGVAGRVSPRTKQHWENHIVRSNIAKFKHSCSFTEIVGLGKRR